MPVFRLTRISQAVERFTGNQVVEISLSNVVKYLVENKGSTTAYLEFEKGENSLNVDIPRGETREFTATTGFKFYQPVFLHWNNEAGDVLVIKQIAHSA